MRPGSRWQEGAKVRICGNCFVLRGRGGKQKKHPHHCKVWTLFVVRASSRASGHVFIEPTCEMCKLGNSVRALLPNLVELASAHDAA